MIQPKDKSTAALFAPEPAPRRVESLPGRVAEPPALSVHPGMEVRPQQRELVDLSAATVVDGVGEVWMWAAFTEARRASSPRDWVVKRASREEARRLGEAARELVSARLPVEEQRPWRARLETIAAMSNADLLSAAESLASVSPRRRGPLFDAVRAALAQAGRRIDLRAAQELVKTSSFAEIKAPEGLAATLLWLAARTGECPSSDDGLAWVLSHETGHVGLTGLILALDTYFQELTGRRPSTTAQSRQDRLSSLQLRLSMRQSTPALAESPPRPDIRPIEARISAGQNADQTSASAAATQQPAALLSSAQRGTAGTDRAHEGHAPEASGRGEDRGADEIESGRSLLGFALPKLRGKVRSESLDEPNGGIQAPSEVEPAPTSAPRGTTVPTAESVRARSTSAELEMAAIVRRLANCERELEILRAEFKTLRESSEVGGRRGRVDRASLEIEDFPSLDDKRGGAGRWLTERGLVAAAAILFVLAGAVLYWRFSEPDSSNASKSSAPSTLGETKNAVSAQLHRSDGDFRKPAATAATGAVAVPSPGNAAAEPSAPVAIDEAGEALPQSGLDLPPEAPAEESEAHSPLAPADVAVVESGERIPSVDEAAEPASGEQLAERFGAGMAPTHKFTAMTKIFGYKEKDPYKIHQVPGMSALIEQCVLALAPRETYPKKLYPGYQTILLSCAGDMRPVCDALGCEPQQGCVTAASWVKPCDE